MGWKVQKGEQVPLTEKEAAVLDEIVAERVSYEAFKARAEQAYTRWQDALVRARGIVGIDRVSRALTEELGVTVTRDGVAKARKARERELQGRGGNN